MTELSNLYPQLHQLLKDLAKMGVDKPFIGYGNPNADILIIGQECALVEGSLDYNQFYRPNYKQWEDSFNGHGFTYKHGIQPYSFENKAFHPIYPFYLQDNKKAICGSTYMYYQKLIDEIRSVIYNTEYERSNKITFFKDCFITELSDICMPNHNETPLEEQKKIRKLIEEHIRIRFEWMRKTDFFKHFKVVVLACGPYANAIKKDDVLKKDLFGNAEVFYCNQLSRWDKKHLEENSNEIGIIKSIAKIKPRVSSKQDLDIIVNTVV